MIRYLNLCSNLYSNLFDVSSLPGKISLELKWFSFYLIEKISWFLVQFALNPVLKTISRSDLYQYSFFFNPGSLYSGDKYSNLDRLFSQSFNEGIISTIFQLPLRQTPSSRVLELEELQSSHLCASGNSCAWLVPERVTSVTICTTNYI